MKGKLIKLSETHYIVVDDSEIKNCYYYNSLDKAIRFGNNLNHPYHYKITHSTEPLEGVGKLSLKNCQAIERGYDLDELANGEYRNFPNKANGEEPLPRWGEDQHASKKQKAYKKGFQKALSILGDKKFSHGQMLNAMDLVWEWMNGEEYGCETLTEVQNKHIQSLKQTEWDVIVEIGCCGNYTPPCNNNCEYGSKPLLDKDGCLILKRI